MGYPLSSEVSAGQPTAAAHYNHLRADALRLGCAEADAVNLADLLARFEDGLRLEVLDGNRLRVPASLAEPVSLVIDGAPLQICQPVDLSTSSAPGGAASLYYVYAVRSGGSDGFSLDVNTSSLESNGRRRIGRFYWDGTRIDPSSLRSERGAFIEALLGTLPAQMAGGRLSLSAGEGLPAQDVSAAGTLYYTPWRGNRVSLYAESGHWREWAFAELSLSLQGLAANTNADVFVRHDGNGLVLEKTAWSSATQRAAALKRQDGVLVKDGAPGWRYLGTVRTTTEAGKCDDSALKRFVWNADNRVPRGLRWSNETLHTYDQSLYRVWNNDASQGAQAVVGVSGEAMWLSATVDATPASMAVFGVGVNAGNLPAFETAMVMGSARLRLACCGCALPQSGHNTIYTLEYAAGVSTFTKAQLNGLVMA